MCSCRCVELHAPHGVAGLVPIDGWLDAPLPHPAQAALCFPGLGPRWIVNGQDVSNTGDG